MRETKPFKSGLLVPFLLCMLFSNAQRGPLLSSDAEFYLLTQAPGAEVYSQWGHSALRLQDPVQRVDQVFNYGTFSFKTDFFVLKFARGQLDYLLSLQDYNRWLAHSAQENRTVTAQRLRLSHIQKTRLYQALLRNALPQNRTYRYDFFFDNCATRLVTVVQAALGDSIRFDTTWGGSKSFRTLQEPYIADNPWLRLGVQLGLGARADRPATTLQYTYLPDSLAKAYNNAQIATPTGWQPFVVSTEVVYQGAPLPPPTPDTPFWLAAMLFVFALAVMLNATRRQLLLVRWPWHARLFGTVLGFAGLFIVFLWFFTEHRVTPENWNLLWAFPLHGVMVWLPVHGRWHVIQQRYAQVGIGLCGIALLLGLLGVQHFPPTAYLLMVWVALQLLVRYTRLKRTPSR